MCVPRALHGVLCAAALACVVVAAHLLQPKSVAHSSHPVQPFVTHTCAYSALRALVQSCQSTATLFTQRCSDPQQCHVGIDNKVLAGSGTLVTCPTAYKLTVCMVVQYMQ